MFLIALKDDTDMLQVLLKAVTVYKVFIKVREANRVSQVSQTVLMLL